MSAIDVLAALPHRFPILLVDRVREVVPGERLTAVKVVSLNEPWYAGVASTGTPPAYPRTLLIESWGQAAALLAGVEKPQESDSTALGSDTGSTPLFGSVTGLRFHRPVHPGDVLIHRVRLAKRMGDNLIFEGDTLCDGEPVITVQRMVLAFRPADVLRPPAAAAEPDKSTAMVQGGPDVR